ncbi:hypothetical protein MNBD_GAMMA24-331 [hydrothermal vent metagenome]|uniref:Uncharacterized protein n=1 Tax=hydrothermal vent metagenome TaxID=652676 RepID=A0A3B1BDM5_9ZZZZ
MKTVDEIEFLNQVENLAIELYAAQALSKSSSMAKPPPVGIDRDAISDAREAAEAELAKTSVRQTLCAALRSTSNNIRDVTKVVAAALLPLSQAGVIALPLTPIAFAAVAVIVFDIGVAAYCADQPNTS